MDLENWMLGLVKGVIIFLQMEIRKLANIRVPTMWCQHVPTGPGRRPARTLRVARGRARTAFFRAVRAVLDWRMFQKSPALIGFGTKSIKTI